MKLHLPSGLRAALFACFAAFAGIGTTLTTATITGGVFAVSMLSAGQAAASTTIDGIEYSGDVYTWVGKNSGDFHNGGIIKTIQSDGVYTYSDYTTDWAGTVQGLFCNGSVYNTLRFVNAGATLAEYTVSTSNVAPTCSFSPLLIGGLIVESGASNYTLRPNNNNERIVKVGQEDGATVVFTIKESFSLGDAANSKKWGSIEFNNTTNIAISENKTLTLNAGSVTVATGVNVAVSGDGTLVVGDFVVNGSLENSGVLNLNGATTLTSAIVNNGTITFGEGATLDISALSETNNTYTLFTAGEGALGTVTGLSIDNISGVDLVGKNWTFSDDYSTLSYALAVQDLTYGGGALTWNVGAEMDNSATFANEDMVTFTGDTDATLAAALTSCRVTINDGVTLSLSNGGTADYTLAAEQIRLNGTLELKDAALADTSVILAESTGELVVDVGTGTQNAPVFESGYAGSVTVRSGILVIDSTGTGCSTASVEDGGQLKLSANYSGSLAVTGSGLAGFSYGEDGFGAVRITGGSYSGTLTATGDTSLVLSTTTALDAKSSVIAGSGTLTLYLQVNSDSHVNVRSTFSHTGDVVLASGTMRMLEAQSVSLNSFIIESGATLHYERPALQCSTDVVLRGGTLKVQEVGGTRTARFDELQVTGSAGNISHTNAGTLAFSALTGDQALNISVAQANSAGNGLILDSVQNYNGTLTVTGTLDNYHLQIGTVSQDAGYTMKVDDGCGVESTGFSKLGQGGFVAGVLKVSGMLDMKYEGTLTLTSIKVADGTVLHYGSAGTLLDSKLLTLEGSVVIDVFDILSKLDDSTGIKLGISKTVDKSLIDISSLGSAYTADNLVANDDGSWYLTGSSASVATAWDINWGSGLAGQPASIASANIKKDLEAGFIYLAKTDTDDASNIESTLAVNLASTKDGTGDVYVFGGAGSPDGGITAGDSVTVDSWLQVTGGTYKMIAGGNYANNYDGGTVCHFTGNSHILLEAGSLNGAATTPTVAHIIGGNYKDGQSPIFDGSSYISVKDGQVNGAIIGGSTGSHNKTATFTGDTNIWVYKPLASSAGALGHVPQNVIVGGCASTDNTGSALKLLGSSNVHIDFSGYTAQEGDSDTMTKMVLGGNFLSTSASCSIGGDTNVSVIGTNASGGNITFAEKVIGGTYNTRNVGTDTISGNINVDITGGYYFWQVIGGGYLAAAGGTSNVTGDVSLTLTNAECNFRVTGGSYFQSAGGSSTIAGKVVTTLTNSSFMATSDSDVIAGHCHWGGGVSHIGGGTVLTTENSSFSGRLVGGSFLDVSGGSASINGGTSMLLKGSTGSYSSVYGGSVMKMAGSSSTISGGTSIEVEDGTINGESSDNRAMLVGIVGGSYVKASDTEYASSVISGTSSITLNGGTSSAAIVGGSVDSAGISQITTGDVDITLNGGTWSGDVIGGSYITGTGTDANVQTSGDITITLNGAEVGNIYGGTYTERDAATAQNQHGDIVIDLASGTVTGDVYAAGAQTAASGMQVGSTTVKLASGVTLTAGKTISGTAKNATDATTFSGTRTLDIAATGTEYADIIFSGFDVVNTAGDVELGLVAGTSLTKTGAGTLKMNSTAGDDRAASLASLTVSEGAFDGGTAWFKNGGNGLTSISIGAGAQVNLTAVALADGASLALDLTGATASSAAMLRTMGSDSGDWGTSGLNLLGSVNLTLDGLDSLATDTAYTLLEWQDSSGVDLSDFLLDTTGLANPSLYALALDGNKLVLKVGTLVDSWIWSDEDGGGSWEDAASWGQTDDDTPDGKALTFGDAAFVDTVTSCTVTLSDQVTPASVLVTPAAGHTYVFTGDGGIAEGSLEMNGAGTLVLATANKSTDTLTITQGTVQLGLADDDTTADVNEAATGSWAGSIAVNGTSTLNVVNAGAAENTGAITAEAGATVEVAGGNTLASVSGGNLTANTAVGSDVTIKETAGSFTSVTNGAGVLSFGSDVTIGTLNNDGVLKTTGESHTVTITDVTAGGTVETTYGTLNIHKGGTFSRLSAGYVNAGTSTVTLTGDSTIHTLSTTGNAAGTADSAASLAVTGGTTNIRENTALQNLMLSETGSARVQTGSGKSLTVYGDISSVAAADTTAAALSNAGVDVASALTVKGNVTLTAGNLEAVGVIDLKGTVDVSGNLKSSGQNVDIAGTTTVGGDFSSNYRIMIGDDISGASWTPDSALTSQASLTVTGDVNSTNSGITVTGDVKVGDDDATSKSNLSVNERILILGAADVEGNLESRAIEGASNTIVVYGKTSVDGNVSAYGDVNLGQGTTLTVGSGDDAAAVTVAAAAVDIGGNLTSTAGNVALGKGGTIGGNLDVGGGALTLGAGLTVGDKDDTANTGAITGLTTLTVQDSARLSLSTTTALLQANSLTLPTDGIFTLNINELGSLGIQKDTSIIIASTETAMADLSGKLNLVVGTDGAAVIADEVNNVFKQDAMVYTLTQDADKKQIIITATYVGCEWVSTDGVWDSTTPDAGTSSDWSTGNNPTSDSSVVFGGAGSDTVAIDGTVSVASVLVDPTKAAQIKTTSYLFTGTNSATVDTDTLTVSNGGTLMLDKVSVGTATDALQTVTVGSHVLETSGDEIGLMVNTPGSLYVGDPSAAEGATYADAGALYTGKLDVLEGSTLVNSGLVVVNGAMTSTDNANLAVPSVVNNGKLVFGAGSSLGTVTGSGVVEVTGASTIGSINGATDVTVTGAGVSTVTGEFKGAGTGTLSMLGGAELQVGTTDAPGAVSGYATLSVGAAAVEDENDPSNNKPEETGTLKLGALSGATALAAQGTGSAIYIASVAEGQALDLTVGTGALISIGDTATPAATALTVNSLVGGGTFSTERNVALAQTVTSSVALTAKSLDLSAASGSTLGSVTTDALTMNLSALCGDGAPASLLTVTSLNTAGALTLTLTGTATGDALDALLATAAADLTVKEESISTIAGDALAYTDYTLVAGAGLDETSTITVTDADKLQQAFALAGNYARVVVDANGNLVLRVTEDDPRYWNGGDFSDSTTDDKWAGNPENNGGHVLDLSQLDTYTALDTVDIVKLGKDTEIDLTAATKATDDADGLVISQLTNADGVKPLLTLKGDDKDLVTLDNAAGDSTFTGTVEVLGLQVQTAGAHKLTVDYLRVGTLTVPTDTDNDPTTADENVEHKSSLTVNGGDALAVTDSMTVTNASATVKENGTLTVGGTTTLNGTGALTNDGTATLAEVKVSGMGATVTNNGTLTAGAVAISGDGAKVENAGTLDVDSVTLSHANATLSSVAGASTKVGALNGTAGTITGTITVDGQGGDYSGSYGDAKLVLAADATQDLSIGGASGSGNLALEMNSGAASTLSYSGNAALQALYTDGADVTLDRTGTGTLTAGNDSAMVGGTLSYTVDVQDVIDGTVGAVTSGIDLVGTKVHVNAGDNTSGITFDVTQDTTGWTLFSHEGAGSLTADDVSLEGAFFDRYFENVTVENGVVKADLVTDYYTEALGETENGKTGLQMLDMAELQVNPQAGDLADVLGALKGYKGTGDSAAADALASAVAGSGLASVGMALAGDVERQLKAIRNRTTTMGVDPSVVNEAMPYFNAWINAEGDHRSLDQDSTLAGYTLTSWGGTVGFDMDVNPTLTWGLALTAMYGDFSSESADIVDGDMDTYYVSAFARQTSGAWVHTFVATAGLSKSDISRTVSHSGGSYSTQAEVDGMSFGFLYEVARTFALNEDATACWQPVFNVAYRHISVDGYEEEGSDAGLSVGDQTLNTVTFGLGARLQAVVGENIYNRTSIFEGRALVKFDAGDRESEMDTTLLGVSAAQGKVKSAEVDAFGIELGAGLSIPVGMESGTIFLDGSVEFRGSYTSANGTVGYRVNF